MTSAYICTQLENSNFCQFCPYFCQPYRILTIESKKQNCYWSRLHPETPPLSMCIGFNDTSLHPPGSEPLINSSFNSDLTVVILIGGWGQQPGARKTRVALARQEIGRVFGPRSGVSRPRRITCEVQGPLCRLPRLYISRIAPNILPLSNTYIMLRATVRTAKPFRVSVIAPRYALQCGDVIGRGI